MLEIANATVTLNALHCQNRTATRIRKHQGHYLLCVKDNQKGLHGS